MYGFTSLPIEIKENIVRLLDHPIVLTRSRAKSWGRDVVSIAKTNRELYGILCSKESIPKDKIIPSVCESKLHFAKRINKLIDKYNIYQEQYEHSFIRFHRFSLHEPIGNPMLLDALFTGCKLPFVQSTFNTYSEEIERDIGEMVKLLPESIHCSFGSLRGADDLPPLLAACVNPVIPIHIVRLLLENGADPNQKVRVIDQPWHMFRFFSDWIPLEPERMPVITKLFNEYGGECS